MRTRARRACFAGALVALVLGVLAPASAQEEIVRPDVFRASATAHVASVEADREALLPVPELFRFIALDGAGTYESSNQTARASVFYPGNGVISGPNLFCGTFGGQFPPEFAPVIEACQQYDYPLTVFADSLNPDARTDGSAALGGRDDPVSANGASAVAHADIDGSRTDAAVSDLRVLGLPAIGAVPVPLPGADGPDPDPSILTVEGATSRTDQRILEDGSLAVEAVSTLSGVRLVGGIVEIESIRSTATITDDGRGEQTHEARFAAEGVTVGGIPAELTDEGLVVGSPTGADGPLRQQLGNAVNELVRGLGVEITTLEVEEGVDDAGLAFARVGGMLVEFSLEVSQLPLLPGPQGDLDPNGIYRATLQLGAAGATGTASFIDEPVFDPGPASPSPPVDGAPSSSPLGPIDDSPLEPSSDAQEAAEPTTPPHPSDEGVTEEAIGFVDELFADRLAFLYLSFTLTALGLCLAPGLGVPARLPRSAP